MPHSPVYICTHVVWVKAGCKPDLCIDSPEDISEVLRDIRSNQFEELKLRMVNIVVNEEFGMFFHKDKSHMYRFDESSLQKSAVYGMKDMRKNGDRDKKLTASKLVPL